MSDDEFLAAFEECTLTRSEWTHEAHVRMAWLYLTRFKLTDSIEKARNGIRRLNATFTKAKSAAQLQHSPEILLRENNPPDAYHDTITVAFVRLIAFRIY